MAAITTISAAPSRAQLLLRRSSGDLRRHRSLRCSASSGSTPPLLKLAVGGVTALLSLLSPNKPRSPLRYRSLLLRVTNSVSQHLADFRRGDPSGGAVSVARSADDVVGILRSDFQRAYFLTGNFTPEIYAGDCLYEDPTISFRGKDKYARNLQLLIPFFDSPSLKLEKIEKGCTNEMSFIVAAWKLSTYLKFPWKPLISIRGSTIYDLDEEFKIVRHSESWDISALEAVAQIFTFGPRQGGD